MVAVGEIRSFELLDVDVVAFAGSNQDAVRAERHGLGVEVFGEVSDADTLHGGGV